MTADTEKQTPGADATHNPDARLSIDGSVLTKSDIEVKGDQKESVTDNDITAADTEQIPDHDIEKSPEAVQSQPVMPGGAPPDGGREAWTVVAGAFCCLFVSFGWINCIGVFQDYYQTHQLKDLSSSTVAWIVSLETFVMFVGGPVCGRIFDNYGPRYLLLCGTILHVFGLMMTSISSKYYQFILAQGICSPMGASAIFNGAMTSVATWFHHRRGLAFGIMASGSSLGGVTFPIMVYHLVPEVGFAWAMRICAFLILGLLIIANLTVKSRLNHRPKPFDILDFFRPFAEVPYVLLCLGGFFFFWGVFLPFAFVILQTERYGMSARLAAYLVPILNSASIFGRTLPGYVADRIGRFNTMVVMTFFSSLCVLAIWLPSRTNAVVILFSAFYGFGSGAFVSLGPALVAQISDVRKIGVRNGSYSAFMSIAALTGNPIGGALVTNALTGSFWRLQVFCGVVMVVGCVFFAAARVRVGGWRVLDKV